LLKKIVLNDLKGSKLVSITIFSFILFASFVLSTVGIVAVNLNASINLFLEKSKAPHFLQMHMGDFDNERMDKFAQNNEYVLDYQALPFLNVDSSDIIINGERFSENSQDNGFSYQSENFDFLLDIDNSIIYPKEGEIYVPLVYFTNGNIKTGDCITVSGLNFIVKGAVRDSQMSSMLSSSKRFLVHQSDYEKIKHVGREEILIEFLLNNRSSIDLFQSSYFKADLESNGPTVTYSIIKLMNALTDGIMIAILSLIAFLVIVVSFLCIRLTLVSKIEDEYKTIGVVKAIGLRLSIIKRIYRGKYAIISVISCLLGLIFSLAFSGYFLQNIRMFFGENESTFPAVICALAGAVFIFLIVMLYVNRFLNKLKNISPARAINKGVVSDNVSSLKSFKLREQNILPTDIFLGINLILTRKKTYFTFILILIIASFVIILPNNIYSSMASDIFITYMGIGNGQVMMIFPGMNDLIDLNTVLENDPDIEEYVVYDNKSYEFMLNVNTVSKMWVTLGNQNKFPLLYTVGHAPQQNNDIALSYLNASSLGKKVGDSLTLIIEQQKKNFVITGIYSDITNGGKTARAAFSDDSKDSLSKSVIMNFKKDTPIKEKINSFEKNYPNAKIYHIESYRDAVFGSTLNSIKTAGITGMILSIGLTFLITLLFNNMLVVKDRRNISILKSLGFTYKSIRNQYTAGTLLIVFVSIIIGMILVNTIGQSVAGFFIQSMGIANFKFIPDLGFVLFITPFCILITVFLGINIAYRSIKIIKVSDYIKGEV